MDCMSLPHRRKIMRETEDLVVEETFKIKKDGVEISLSPEEQKELFQKLKERYPDYSWISYPCTIQNIHELPDVWYRTTGNENSSQIESGSAMQICLGNTGGDNLWQTK